MSGLADSDESLFSYNKQTMRNTQCVCILFAITITSSIVVRVALQPVASLQHLQYALAPLLRQYLLNLYRPMDITGLPKRDIVKTASGSRKISVQLTNSPLLYKGGKLVIANERYRVCNNLHTHVSHDIFQYSC